jgi:hypothetical protein
VELTYADDTWEIRDIWEAFPRQNLLAREVLLTRKAGGAKEIKGRGLQMQVDGLRREAKTWSHQQLTLFLDPATSHGLHCLFDDRDEGVDLSIISQDSGWRLEYSLQLLARMQAGDRQTIGTQVFRACRGDELSCKRQGHALYADRGLAPPANRPADVQDTVFYSLHPGGNIDTWFQCVGGFDNLQKWLPNLQRIGANTLWLLPTYTYCADGKLGKGCPYGPMDFWHQEAALGGDDAARRFVDASHALGYRVLFDIVPHGGSYVDRERHPNWICRDEDGKPINWFGAGCDFSAAGYQRDIQDIAEYVVRTYDIDGFRIDCAAGGPPNWSTEAKRVSSSTLGGALGLTAAIRRGFTLAKPGVSPLFYPEEWGSQPPFAPITDIDYGGPLYWFMEALRKGGRDPEKWGTDLQQWLSDEHWGQPPGVVHGRYITNHDMDCANGPASLAWGMARSRALMAMCFGIDGAPFVYQEQEVGAGPQYALLAAARRAIPELRRGAVDYDRVHAEDLLACLRSGDDGATLVLVNFTPRPGARHVQVDAAALGALGKGVIAVDALTGEKLPEVGVSPTSFTVQMPGFAARYIVLRQTDAKLASIGVSLDVYRSPREAAAQPVVSQPSSEGASLRLTQPMNVEVRLTGTVAAKDDVKHVAPAADGALGDIADVALTTSAAGGDVLLRWKVTPKRDLRHGSGVSVEMALTSDDIARWFAVGGDCLWEDWQWQRHFNWAEGNGYGYGPGIMHQGKQLSDRLYESGVHPLHSSQPWFALATAQGGVLTARIDAIEGLPAGFTGPNVYYGDGSNAKSAVSKPGWRIALVDRYYPGRPQSGPQVVGLAGNGAVWPAGQAATVTVRLHGAQIAHAGATASWEPAALQVVTGKSALSWDNPLGGEQRVLPGSDEASRGMADLVWGAFKKMKLGWSVPVVKPGTYDLWIRARNSENAANATDLCDKYQVSIDGATVQPKWRGLGSEKIGDNGYIGWMQLRGVKLDKPAFDLWVGTTANWCAIDDRFILSADPAWAPEAVQKAEAAKG